MVYTNADLYEGIYRDDHLFVVGKHLTQTTQGLSIEIDLYDQAVVIDKHASNYVQPYTIGNVRSDEGGAKGKDLWLLSGGTIIRDHKGRIAVGLRDGNAADPFKYTNIGAGRCDRKLEEHCYEEMVSEFILCLKDQGQWIQVQLRPPSLPPLLSQVRIARSTISKWKARDVPTAELMPLRLTKAKEIAPTKQNLRKMEVVWIKDGKKIGVENLKGYVFADAGNHTLEFRMAYNLDLSEYNPEEVEIFFAEGTGFADWKSESDLQQLANLDLVTPLLKALLT